MIHSLKILASVALVSSFALLAPPVAAQAAPVPAPAAKPARQPLEAFASVPQFSSLVLAPDGRQVAAVINDGDRSTLTRLDVQGGKPTVLVSTDNKAFSIGWVRWVSQERLLLGLRFPSKRDMVDTVETRLFSVRADGKGLFNLVPPEGGNGSLLSQGVSSQVQDRVIDWMPRDGRHVLLALAAPGSTDPAVYKISVEDGSRVVVEPPRRHVKEWITDAKHRVRIGIRSDEGQHEIIYREPLGKEWRTLWKFDSEDAAVWPLGFGKDEQELFVLANHQGRQALFAVRLDQPGLPRRLLLSHERYDIDGQLLLSPLTGDALGLRGNVQAAGEARAELWAPAWRAQMKALDLALPQRDNRLVGLSADEQRYLVYSQGNGQPGQYYFGDRSTGDVELIGETYPHLDVDRLALKKTLHIKARDGLELESLLTLPKDHAGGPLPMVLLPHGGPHGRDDEDFDYWTAFLADRGYAVLQVNFRGSAGQGSDFMAAGLRRWGLEMQDDLSDAVQWAVAQGVAMKDRVCIVGGSYGGYAALMGLVKTPQLYRCGVSFAGVTDLQELVAYESRYVGGQAAAERQIGRYWGDRERLRATSPVLQAARIQAPVLLVHGSLDRVVPVSQGKAMASALRSAGKPHRYLELDGGDHHLGRDSHRLAFFRALEGFLAEHLGGQAAAR